MSVSPDNAEARGPLSIERLRRAMAGLLSAPAKHASKDTAKDQASDPEHASDSEAPATDTSPDDDVVTLRGIVEATLFVGREDDGPIAAEAIAAPIEDATEADVAQAVAELNAAYEHDASAVRIESSASGYRLRVDPGLERVGDRLHRRVRAARLSTAAQETLSVIAYRQPITPDEVEALREQPSAGLIKQLVRHELVRREASDDDAPPRLVTTDRFLRLVGVASLDQLPRVAELDD
ncbi:MAG: SMC-Scp complex subunit ScpB [Planctomycetota bacterium]